MPRPRFALAALAGLVLTVPLGGCPLDVASLGGPPVLSGGRFTTVQANVDPAKTTLASGESVRLWVTTNLDGGGLSYSWSASGGSLSSSSGQEVYWTAGGPGRFRVSCTVSSGQDTRPVEYLFTVR